MKHQVSTATYRHPAPATRPAPLQPMAKPTPKPLPRTPGEVLVASATKLKADILPLLCAPCRSWVENDDPTSDDLDMGLCSSCYGKLIQARLI